MKNSTKSNVRLLKGLSMCFALAALGGCATMNFTEEQSCMQRSGYAVNVPLLAGVSHRNDNFNEQCATARAATTIASMRRADGTPDMAMYNLAISMYEQSNPQVKAFMDKMLKEQGTSITQMKFDIDKTKEPLSCARVDVKDASGRTVNTGFKCTPKTAPKTAASGLTGA